MLDLIADMDQATKRALDDFDKRIDALEKKGLSPRQSKRLLTWMASNKPATALISLLTLVSAVLATFATPLYERHLSRTESQANTLIDARIDAKLVAPNDQLRKIGDGMTALNSKLDTLQPFLTDVVTRRFEEASKLPVHALLQRLSPLQDLVSVAAAHRVELEPHLVSNIGNKLVHAS